MKSGMNSKGNWTLFELSEFEISGFYSTNEGKKACEVNRANIFCRKIKAEGSVTL